MQLIIAIFDGVAVGTVALAWAKGSAAERVGTSLNLVMVVLVWAIHEYAPPAAVADLVMTTDGILALGFLGLAVVYAYRWIGVALLLQAVQFGLHAAYYVQHRPADLLHAWVNNLDSWGVLTCLFVGTVLAWRARGARTPAA